MAVERSEDTVATLCERVLGYCNFSSGSPDPVFARNLDLLVRQVADAGTGPLWLRLEGLLRTQLTLLEQRSPAFSPADQAEAVLRLVFREGLPAYREHHRDLLGHLTDDALFNSFFIARFVEAVLSQGSPWDESDRILRGAIEKLNDFVGHRPVAVLHNGRQTEPYTHERVRPLPLYIREAGVAHGPYGEVVQLALQILEQTEGDILDQADFSLRLLDELAIDPRAYDFGHPVNRRPNYQFGEWDPHHLDNSGRFRRFVIRQVTLDALRDRIETTSELPRAELLWEAAAVLAGVILMAAGTSGSGPDRHDSGLTLSKLVPKIAAYRDKFYQNLLAKVEGEHGNRLRTESTRTRQPFGGARQHLNRYLARLRAAQLQHFELARIFAELGDLAASLRQTQVIPAVRVRMLCEITSRITLAHHDLDAGRLADAADRLENCEALLHRAVECGAFVDPWNILGFGGQFSLFASVENSIQDARVEELVELVENLFAVQVRIVSEAACAGQVAVVEQLIDRLQRLARWWDQFATHEVQSVGGVLGRECCDSARHLADVLGRWHAAGAAAGDVLFWRNQSDGFNSPKSYSLVIESLLGKNDHISALALLMQWLGQAEQVPLEQDSFSFYNLAMRWMQGPNLGSNAAPGRLPWPLVRKFFDFLEANAEDYWRVPGLDLGTTVEAHQKPQRANEKETHVDDEDEDDEENPFGAAYEGMSYRDSTRDGNEADMLQGGPSPADSDEWLERAQWLAKRLRFLSMLAELTRLAIGRHLPGESATATDKIDPAVAHWPDTLTDWFNQARSNQQGLLRLLEIVQEQPLGKTMGTNESLAEDDRRRRIQTGVAHDVLNACVASERAAMSILAVLPLERADALPAWSELPTWQLLAIQLERAACQANVAAVAQLLPAWLEALKSQPLLYVPISKGGEPKKVVLAQRLQQVLREVLRFLPRLGLFDSTYQVIEAARAMEKRFPAGPRAVTEFDRLFQVGFQALIETLSLAADHWPPPSGTSESADERLVDFLQVTTESLLKQWLQHEQSVRLSVIERISDEGHWQRLVTLIRTYGKEIFTVPFMGLGNLRSILHRGVATYLESLKEAPDVDELPAIVVDLETKLNREQTLADLELILEAVAENYEQYKDYKNSTTQSDSGDNLYMLLDFLRLKASYDRVAWRLKPLALAHEILVRQGKLSAAEGWRRLVAEKTGGAAQWHLERLSRLERAYSIQLPTVGDRIRERFLRSFQLDRIRALVRPAVSDAWSGNSSQTLQTLEEELEEYARTPTGAGLDVPQWLISLANEVREARRSANPAQHPSEWSQDYPRVTLTLEQIQDQLEIWRKVDRRDSDPKDTSEK